MASVYVTFSFQPSRRRRNIQIGFNVVYICAFESFMLYLSFYLFASLSLSLSSILMQFVSVLPKHTKKATNMK